MSNDILLHITTQTDWEQAKATGEYRAASLETEGFIHLSTPVQVVTVANHLFRGQSDLVLLVLNAALLTTPVHFDNVPGHGTFPHLYGPLNLSAVSRVLPFAPQADTGLFDLTEILPDA